MASSKKMTNISTRRTCQTTLPFKSLGGTSGLVISQTRLSSMMKVSRIPKIGYHLHRQV